MCWPLFATLGNAGFMVSAIFLTLYPGAGSLMSLWSLRDGGDAQRFLCRHRSRYGSTLFLGGIGIGPCCCYGHVDYLTVYSGEVGGFKPLACRRIVWWRTEIRTVLKSGYCVSGDWDLAFNLVRYRFICGCRMSIKGAAQRPLHYLSPSCAKNRRVCHVDSHIDEGMGGLLSVMARYAFMAGSIVDYFGNLFAIAADQI